MRLQAMYNISQQLLMGLKCFVVKSAYWNKTVEKKKTDNYETIEEVLAKLQLTMIEITTDVEQVRFITSQILYSVYEGLINTAICGVVVHVWSSGYHCVYPETDYSCWTTLLIAAVAVVAFQTLQYVLYLTGIQARETKMALSIGLVVAVFFLFIVLLTPEILHPALGATITMLATHTNALLSQISPSIVEIPLGTLGNLYKIWVAVLIGSTAAGMVIPAIRFGQTFSMMNYGTIKASALERIVLWLDLVIPFLVGVLFFVGPRLVSNSAFCNSEDEQCVEPTTIQDNPMLLSIQIVSVVFMVLIRMGCMKLHLQTFLDAVVQAISMQIASPDEKQRSTFQARVKVRFFYR